MKSQSSSTRMVSALAILVAIVGLTMGFAAFANTLKIESSATVTGNENFLDVNFSSSSTGETEGAVTPTLTPANVDKFTAETATIDNTDDPTISGLKANFTNPGQVVKYSFYAHNNGKLAAYLKTVDFANVEGTSYKKCTAKTGTTQALVDQACAGISLSVKVGTGLFTGTQENIDNHVLSILDSEPVEVTITYAADSKVADGDFDVAFGDITLTYSSTN